MNIPFILQTDPEYNGCSWYHHTDSSDYSHLVWNSEEKDKPSEEELQNKWDTEYQIKFDEQQAIKNRKTEYPKIEDLVIALWEKVVEGNESTAEELQNFREEIKNKYPKS